MFFDAFIQFKNILQKCRKHLAQPINLLNLKQGKIMHDYGGTHTSNNTLTFQEKILNSGVTSTSL